MLLDLEKLKHLLAVLEVARRNSERSGQAYFCDAPFVGADGKNFRWEPKPRSRYQAGHRYRNGDVLEVMSDDGKGFPELGIKIKLGVHGRSHLAIDPETNEVFCSLCRKESDS